MILLDTSGLLSTLDAAQRRHDEAAKSLSGADPPLVLSPFVLAELDYLLAARVGEAKRVSLLREVERGAYQLASFAAADVRTARAIIERHADLLVSLADASIVVVATRHKVNDVLTLDERHFRVLTAGRKPLAFPRGVGSAPGAGLRRIPGGLENRCSPAPSPRPQRPVRASSNQRSFRARG